MTIFIVLLVLVAMAVAGLVNKRRLIRRLPRLADHSKKEILEADGVEIVIQKPGRVKLALPDLSRVQTRSPVGPMKSSIRCALKELRSRQMVQQLCSRFESRLIIPSETKAGNDDNLINPTPMSALPTKGLRKGEWNATVAPVPLAKKAVNDAEVIASVRSNNLNKFLRSYASNLDHAISTKRCFSMAPRSFSRKISVPLSTDADTDIEQPLLAPTEEMEITYEITQPKKKKILSNSNDSGIKFELDLRSCVNAEDSNQWDATGDRDEMDSGVINATDCKSVTNDTLHKIDEENNHAISKRGTARYSKAFTLDFSIFEDVTKQAASNFTSNNEIEPERCLDYPAKEALARFKQHVPSNGRCARSLAPLRT